MARSIIGGIVLSTLVTLVLVPVFYVLVERLRGAANKLLTMPEMPETPVSGLPPHTGNGAPATAQPGAATVT
jgi:hypothetical protein